MDGYPTLKAHTALLKKTYHAHFWHALMLGKSLHFFHPVQCCSNVFILKRPVFLAPVSLRPLLLNTQSTLIGQLTHAWASTANNNRAAVLNLCKCVTWWCTLMSQSHGNRGGATDEVFQEQCFLWERGASVGTDFSTFKTFYMNMQHWTCYFITHVGKRLQNNSYVHHLTS